MSVCVRVKLLLLVFIFYLGLAFSPLGFAEDKEKTEDLLADYKLLAISERDESAVIRSASGDMITLEKGARFPGFELFVTQIQNDKVVVRETTAPGDVLVIYKSKNGGPSSVKRIRRVAPTPEQTKGHVTQLKSAGSGSNGKKTLNK